MSEGLLLLAKVLGWAALAAALLLGVRNCQEGLRDEGRAEVREQWAQADNARALAEAQALADMQQRARDEEQRMAREAE